MGGGIGLPIVLNIRCERHKLAADLERFRAHELLLQLVPFYLLLK